MHAELMGNFNYVPNFLRRKIRARKFALLWQLAENLFDTSWKLSYQQDSAEGNEI